MRRSALAALLLACAVLFIGCAGQPGTGSLTDTELTETSGLAATRSGQPGFWALNDSGNGAVLFRLDRGGATLARYPVVGAANLDWEDLASFEWRGSSWLLIADTGDNLANRNGIKLHLVGEPTAHARRAVVHSSVAVHFPDGPRDAEGVAVDPTNESIYLISKRDRPNRLYELQLSVFDAPHSVQTFAAVGAISRDTTPPASDLLRRPTLFAIGGFSTAFDISADGTRAVVLGYRRARVVERRPEERWVEALNRMRPLPNHGLKQAEAVAFDRAGHTITLTSEGMFAPFLIQAWPEITE